MKRVLILIFMMVLTLSLLPGCNLTCMIPQRDQADDSSVASADTTNADNEEKSPQLVEEQAYQESISPDPEEKSNGIDEVSELQISVLDVRQGLSVLISEDDEYVIYDGGGRRYSSYVVSYLKSNGVSSVKYLFASHYDEDHIAGLIGVLRTIPVDEAIIPNYKPDTVIYGSFMSAAEEAKTVTYATAGEQYNVGDATIQILYSSDGTEEAENDRSTVISVTKGDFSCIITGDAEYDTETKLVRRGISLDCDVYVVGHHGSASSSSESFVAAMSPEVSVISVGTGNDYGHPAEKTIQTLSDSGSAIYRTDILGEIRIDSDGQDYSVTAGPDTGTGLNKARDITYVLNKKSKKFHEPDCEFVEKIADYNKEYFYDTREELIRQGYAPCGWCDP